MKPDKVEQDLIANVDDTPFCDFWLEDQFTAYVSLVEYASFDSACFLESHSDLFTTYPFMEGYSFTICKYLLIICLLFVYLMEEDIKLRHCLDLKLMIGQ